MAKDNIRGNEVLTLAEQLRWEIPENFRDEWVEEIYANSAQIAKQNVQHTMSHFRLAWEKKLDWILTSRWTGIPIMVLILAVVLWLTVEGANVPSKMLATLLIDSWHPMLQQFGTTVGLPWWLSGILFDGVYLTVAWVVSVMLPPMAIFFPLFTILEDFGYLPRVAFNLDHLFQKAGAHGKQCLTTCMGFGCNAAGVVATRIIDSPRERLIAIITNNFALCNGRWPTQILVATIFLGALVPSAFAGLMASVSVLGIALFGICLSLIASWGLSSTILKGEASTFSLELPPYRPPNILRTLYTSLIDRTLIILWRAIIFAAPAGLFIWGAANWTIDGLPIGAHIISSLDPVGLFFGLNGVILLAYIVAIPANEIVIPTILMLTVLQTGLTGVGEAGAGVMFEVEGQPLVALLQAGGWTTLTAISLMLFSLCHNPCSTTIYTIYKETLSLKWTTVATLLPLIVGFLLCASVAMSWRLFS